MSGIRLQNANRQQGHQHLTNLWHRVSRAARTRLAATLAATVGFAMLGVVSLGVAGCGTGGYPGGGLTGISASAVTIDSGQAYPITVQQTGSLPVVWSVSCASSNCGTFTTGEGTTTSYVAPTGVASPMTVTVTATIPGTSSKEVVTVTVDPDPTLTAALGAGVVGTPYSGSIKGTPGTAPLTLNVTTSQLPPGLTFNAATGLITGTPTMAGTFTFTAQVTDSSAEPDTVTQLEKIVVTAPVAPIQTLAIGGTLGAGTVGTAYSGTLVASGGVMPYTFSSLSGSLPPGLTLAANGLITGTPTAAGSYTFVGQVKDSTGATATRTFTINVATAVTLTLSAPPSGTVGLPYTGTIGVSGGTAPYTCMTLSGALPLGIVQNNCALTGVPTQAGSFPITVKGTDAAGNSTTGTVTLTIAPALTPLSVSGNPPAGMVGVAYTSTLTAAGGTSPYTFVVASGMLPAGLTLSTTGVLSGTPTTGGTSTFVAQVTDANGATATAPFSVTIAAASTPPGMMLTLAPPPSGTVGTPYSGMIGVSGGTAPYTCTPVSGTLPLGLTENGCTITGTPTQSGSFPITVTATDSGNPANTTTGTVTLVVAPIATPLTVAGNPPNGTVGVAYTTTLMASGGTSPYSFTAIAGNLPPGLMLSTAGVISGTPTAAGMYTFTAQVQDSTGTTASTSFTITVGNAAVLTLTSPAPGTVGVPYMGIVGVSGGTGPYTCMVGTLPAGLTASNCTLSGIPTTAGTYPVMVTATDASNPPNTTSGTVSVVINPASTAATLTLSSPPSGTVGTPYSGSVGVSGGTGPYSCALAGGTLPTGLTLGTGCAITGTPTQSGSFPLMVKATDANGNTTTGPVTLTVNPAGVTILVAANPPAGTVGTPYTTTVTASGGTAPYTFTTTGGMLPTGLTLSSTGTISGTPTTPGTYTFTLQGKDANGNTGTSSYTVQVSAAAATLTLAAPPAGSIYSPYTGSVGVSGGTGPYTCALAGGTLPTGLTLGTGCAITGTPTQSGSFPLTVKATDANGNTTTSTVPLTIAPLATLTLTGSVPNATVGVSYTQTLTAQGGLAPYTYATTAGTLPPGITLSSGGVLSGVPTTVGAYSFTVTATDSQPTPMKASLPLVVLVTYAPTPQDAALNGPYAYLFQGYDDVTAGVLAYQTATVASFTADGKGAVTAGEQDANHQSAVTTGATTANAAFLGTYTLGANYTGYLTLTTLNPDGTVHLTTTYALSVKAPVSPATITAQGSLIEADGNQIVGTKGSGTLLPQTPAAFTPGLTGSYAFGVSGDAPCFLTCTANAAAGPVATVGQIVTNGTGTITGGTSDSNDAAAVTANSIVGGTYGTADANGRLKMSLTQSGTSATTYPTNFAVYVVNANEVFLLSTDSHASYILQAGTAQLQTQPTFSNASMNAAFVGYENSTTNPGLVGSTLQNTLNLSTATLFRGVGNGAGTCNITSVDTAGTTAVVDGLTGLGGSATGLTSILAQTSQTGTTGCVVANNGRGVLQYPVPTVAGLPLFAAPAPRVFYLISPNNGYFLETAFAGLGRFEAQTGTPFSYATTFNGTYTFNNVAASSLASTDDTGTLTTDGAGKYNGTQYLNTGVGTFNVLQLGLTNTGTYTQPDATTGRFTATGGLLDGLATGNLVIYAITPNRFVAVDTSAAATSPSVTLLY